MNYIDKLAHKYPEIAGEENVFSNHPGKLGTPINIQQSTSNLLTTVEIFEGLKVKYCIVFGTLLGIYRDGNLIEHDEDTDIAIWVDEEDELLKIIEKMEENKLILTRLLGTSLISFTRGGDYIDFYIYRKRNKNSNILVLNGKEFNHLGTLRPTDFSKNNTVRFHNKQLACPVDPEGYFQKLYGSDWRVPIKDKHAHIEDRKR